MRILIMYWHGLGDLLCLTPQLRHLWQSGYQVDLLVRPQTIESHLLDACPYVQNLTPLPFTGGGPSEGGASGKAKRKACLDLFKQQRRRYGKAINISGLHNSLRCPGGKILRNNRSVYARDGCRGPITLKPPSDLSLEVFIPDEAENLARTFVQRHYSNGFIFEHTHPEMHPVHNWNARKWIAKRLPKLPIFQASSSPWNDINVAFAMAKLANHRVLSSSVFVHACDAMNIPMDIVHYGTPTPHSLPMNFNKILLYHGKWED